MAAEERISEPIGKVETEPDLGQPSPETKYIPLKTRLLDLFLTT